MREGKESGLKLGLGNFIKGPLGYWQYLIDSGRPYYPYSQTEMNQRDFRASVLANWTSVSSSLILYGMGKGIEALF